MSNAAHIKVSPAMRWLARLRARFWAIANESKPKSWFHQLFFRNRLLLRCIGIRVPSLHSAQAYGGAYGDLTTLLLAWKVASYVRDDKLRVAHEIGIGSYGILSIYVAKKFPALKLSGSTIEPAEIETAQRVISDNQLEIPLILSDVLEEVEGVFDIIWWNLPYYEKQVLEYLERLFRQVRDKPMLSQKGRIVLGFNSVPLKTEEVVNLVGRFPHLRIAENRFYWWNPHRVLSIERCD